MARVEAFGFEHDFAVFDPAEHGLNDSHCAGLRPKTEYREAGTGRRLRWEPGPRLLGRWLREDEDGAWVELEEMPDYTEHVVSDDDSDAAYYLHRLTDRDGEMVTLGSVMKLEEPMRSAVVHWTALGRLGDEYQEAWPYSMLVDDELGVVVTVSQMWAYAVVWISPEALRKVHERVREMKADGEWQDPHPDGATMVFRTA